MAGLARQGAGSVMRRHVVKGEKQVADDKPDIAVLVDQAAKALGLPIAPEYRANVVVNYQRSMAIAQPLLELELDDDLTSGPVFRP